MTSSLLEFAFPCCKIWIHLHSLGCPLIGPVISAHRCPPRRKAQHTCRAHGRDAYQEDKGLRQRPLERRGVAGGLHLLLMAGLP